jgi:pimeloyl-ACP methyl ester carboxylesterase
VIINGPGHGASGDPRRRYSLRDCVSAADQILECLGIGDAVDWVGNAWRPYVGLRFAADRSARCRSLITLGTPVAALSRSERRQTNPLLVVYAVLGPIELVLSGVSEALLSAHTRAHDLEAVEPHPRRPAARRPTDAAQCSRFDVAAPRGPDRSPDWESTPDLDDHGQRPLRIHPRPGRGRCPPHPQRPNRSRDRRCVPGPVGGANKHVDTHPRVLGHRLRLTIPQLGMTTGGGLSATPFRLMAATRGRPGPAWMSPSRRRSRLHSLPDAADQTTA